MVGGGYSNRTRATKFTPTGASRKYPNLQKKRVFVPELNKTWVLTLSTEGIKTINKLGAYAALKKAGIIKKGATRKSSPILKQEEAVTA